MTQPGLFGEAPALLNATPVTPALHEQPIRVLSNGAMRGTLRVVSVAVRTASIGLLALGGGHTETILDGAPENGVRLHTFAFSVQAASGFWITYG
jgi:hypothetical protein